MFIYKIFKYLFVPYFLIILLAASMGRDSANKYLGSNLLNEYLIVMIILILIDLVIYGFKILKRR